MACASHSPAPSKQEYDIFEELAKAWDRIVDWLRKEPEELYRRLARRRSPTLTRPPRNWCLCIRAADTRINSCTAACAPSDAAYPRSHLGPGVPFVPETHTVLITKDLLRKVCMPVHLDQQWKSEVTEVAELVGTSPGRIRNLIRRGIFAVRRVPLLGGRHGWPVPLISCPWPLDPSANNLQPPDPLWAHHWPIMVALMPDDFEQILTRVPRLKDHGPFQGWDWLCPGCGKTADRLYYPLPAKEMVLLLVNGVERDETDELPRYAQTFACRACHRVWAFSRVQAESWGLYVAYVSGGLLYGREVPRPPDYHLAPQRLDLNPTAIDPYRLAPRIPARQRKFVRRRRSAPKAEAVIRLFLQGLGHQDMAKELGITVTAVDQRMHRLLRRHRRKHRKTLFSLLRRMYPKWAQAGPPEYKRITVRTPHKRLAVLKMMLTGQPFAKIAKAIGATESAVRKHVLKLYKDDNVQTPQELAAKLASCDSPTAAPGKEASSHEP